MLRTRPVSNGENGTLSSACAPLFTSLFPERDRTCHLMVHANSDTGQLFTTPLGYRPRRPLEGVMTLQNFVDGGFEVIDARIVVVVRSVGARKGGEHAIASRVVERLTLSQSRAKMAPSRKKWNCRFKMTPPMPISVFGGPPLRRLRVISLRNQKVVKMDRRTPHARAGKPARRCYCFKRLGVELAVGCVPQTPYTVVANIDRPF